MARQTYTGRCRGGEGHLSAASDAGTGMCRRAFGNGQAPEAGDGLVSIDMASLDDAALAAMPVHRSNGRSDWYHLPAVAAWR